MPKPLSPCEIAEEKVKVCLKTGDCNGTDDFPRMYNIHVNIKCDS